MGWYQRCGAGDFMDCMGSGMNEQRLEIVFTNPLRIVEEVEEPSVGKQLMTIEYEQFSIIVEGDHVMYTLPVDHQVAMEVTYVDANNNPAKVDGAVGWVSSDTTIATVTVDSQDSAICSVVPVGKAGQVQVTATADADLGAGVRSLVTICDIEVVAGEAVAGSIQPLGEAQPIAPHVEPVKKS
jgi:hypothetical protein